MFCAINNLDQEAFTAVEPGRKEVRRENLYAHVFGREDPWVDDF